MSDHEFRNAKFMEGVAMSKAEPVSAMVDTTDKATAWDACSKAYDRGFAAGQQSALSTMSTAEPVSDKLRELLSAIPSHDRGLSWELRDYRDRERLEVYGPIAKAFKYILDNTDAVIAALSHVQAPAEANQTLIDAILRACLGPNGEPTELYEAARAILTPPSREVETSNG
jgi:hypothetical protein